MPRAAKAAPPTDEELERKAIETESTETPVPTHIPGPPIYKVPDKLGFRRQPPGRVFVFVGADEDASEAYNWYFYDNNAQRKTPIYEDVLVGYVTNIRIVPKEWKGKWNYKVDLTVQADQEYVVRSGVGTSFASGIVNALNLVEDFSQPLAIMTAKGDEAKVVWGNVADGRTGKQYFCHPKDRVEKLSPIIFDLQTRLGVEVQTGASIKQEIADYEAKKAESGVGGRG